MWKQGADCWALQQGPGCGVVWLHNWPGMGTVLGTLGLLIRMVACCQVQ